jgi:hypothetical protein
MKEELKKAMDEACVYYKTGEIDFDFGFHGILVMSDTRICVVDVNESKYVLFDGTMATAHRYWTELEEENEELKARIIELETGESRW